MFVNLVLPLGYRSANDLADLLVLSARIWSELPPDRRLTFEIDLRDNHSINLRESATPLSEKESR